MLRIKPSFKYSLLLVMAWGLNACSTMPTSRDTYHLSRGMSETELIRIMGEPEEKTSQGYLYFIQYECGTLPYYVQVVNDTVVEYGASKELAAQITEHCKLEYERMQNLGNSLSQMGQVLKPNPPQAQPYQPLMRNCWTDVAGMHCM